MKKIVLLLFITLSPFASVNSQSFKGEILAGATGTQVSGDQLTGFNKGGFLAGIGVHYEFDEHSQVGFRMKYIQKGSRKPTDVEKNDTKFYLLRLNYIEVPLFYHHIIGKKLYIELGPSLAYLAGNSEEDENGDVPFPIPFYSFDLSLGGAVGYPISDNWNFQFGYSQSIAPIREPANAVTTYLNRGQYNSVLSFELLFNIGKKK
jgi:hypothetical protein